MPIAQNLNDPNVLEFETGVVKYLEFETDIWVMEVRAKKRGDGNRLARSFIEYARKRGKNIWGKANPDDSGMSLERCKRWYASMGAVPVQMDEANPHAFRLET